MFQSYEVQVPNASTSSSTYAGMWIDDETKSLLEFLLLHQQNKWPVMKQEQFWVSTAEFVQLGGCRRVKHSGRLLMKHYSIFTYKEDLL